MYRKSEVLKLAEAINAPQGGLADRQYGVACVQHSTACSAEQWNRVVLPSVSGDLSALPKQMEVKRLSYTRPELVTVGRCLGAINGQTTKACLPIETPPDFVDTSPAYEADE